MTRPPRRLGRIGLLIWLLLPPLVVWLLWLSIDRTQGRADPERWRNVPAGPGAASERGLPIKSEPPPPAPAPN